MRISFGAQTVAVRIEDLAGKKALILRSRAAASRRMAANRLFKRVLSHMRSLAAMAFSIDR
jgi:hypothetical protein